MVACVKAGEPDKARSCGACGAGPCGPAPVLRTPVPALALAEWRCRYNAIRARSSRTRSVSHNRAMAARTWAQTWLKPEVRPCSATVDASRSACVVGPWHVLICVPPEQAYPIFVAIGGACIMCAAQCGRQLMSSPDVRISKSERALGVLEDKRFTKEGAEFREHGLRRCAPSPRPARSGNALRVLLARALRAASCARRPP